MLRTALSATRRLPSAVSRAAVQAPAMRGALAPLAQRSLALPERREQSSQAAVTKMGSLSVDPLASSQAVQVRRRRARARLRHRVSPTPSLAPLFFPSAGRRVCPHRPRSAGELGAQVLHVADDLWPRLMRGGDDARSGCQV